MVQNNNKNDSAYLFLMLESFSKIKNFTKNMSEKDFLNDNKTQSAVIMQLQIIGELAKKVPDKLKNIIDIPWKNIVGFRDMISHDYFSLDLLTVWHTIKESAPKAEAEIQKYTGVVK